MREKYCNVYPFFFHIGESYRVGKVGTFHLFQLLLERSLLEVQVLILVVLLAMATKAAVLPS